MREYWSDRYAVLRVDDDGFMDANVLVKGRIVAGWYSQDEVRETISAFVEENDVVEVVEK